MLINNNYVPMLNRNNLQDEPADDLSSLDKKVSNRARGLFVALGLISCALTFVYPDFSHVKEATIVSLISSVSVACFASICNGEASFSEEVSVSNIIDAWNSPEHKLIVIRICRAAVEEGGLSLRDFPADLIIEILNSAAHWEGFLGLYNDEVNAGRASWQDLPTEELNRVGLGEEEALRGDCSPINFSYARSLYQQGRAVAR